MRAGEGGGAPLHSAGPLPSAQINGRAASLITPLRNGNIVHMITSRGQPQERPAAWEHRVVTPKAKKEIRSQGNKRAQQQQQQQQQRQQQQPQPQQQPQQQPRNPASRAASGLQLSRAASSAASLESSGGGAEGEGIGRAASDDAPLGALPRGADVAGAAGAAAVAAAWGLSDADRLEYLATHYRLSGRAAAELCAHNGFVAAAAHLPQLAHTWRAAPLDLA
jgi:hypothetical protein